MLANPRADSFRVFAGYEMNGNTLNGNGTLPAERARLDVFKDNLIGLNDAWATSYAGGLDSNELRASVALPVRWLTQSLDGGYSEYLTPIGRYADLFTQLYTGALNASVILSRDRTQQTSLDAGLNWRRLDRFINDGALTPQTVSVLRGAVTHQHFYDAAQLVASLGVSHGLRILTATRDPIDPPFDVPRAQFLKVDGLLSFAQAFDGVGSLKLDLSGQWTNAPLYADDQLILGSVTTVRGFTRMPFRTDRGAVPGPSSPRPADGVAAGRAPGRPRVPRRGRRRHAGLRLRDGRRRPRHRRAVLGARGSVGGGVRYRRAASAST